MEKIWKPSVFLLLGVVVFALGFYSSASAQDGYEGDPLEGGGLYAAWDAVLHVELPSGNHPLWYLEEPIDLNSWRCVTCHGWDYNGREISPEIETQAGVEYPGVFSMMGEPQEEVMAWLDGSNNRAHDFSAYLSSKNMHDLSAFLSTGLVQSELYIEAGTGKAQGTALAGEDLYKGKCRECHGSDGSRINFGTAERPAFLGNLANFNPWRAAHVIRFGHTLTKVRPGARYGWTFSNEIDLLTYLQHLPLAKQILNEDEVEEEVIDYSQQGEIRPLIYAAAGIVVVILGGVLWGSRWSRG